MLLLPFMHKCKYGQKSIVQKRRGGTGNGNGNVFLLF
jgi:hypothetical protein